MSLIKDTNFNGIEYQFCSFQKMSSVGLSLMGFFFLQRGGGGLHALICFFDKEGKIVVGLLFQCFVEHIVVAQKKLTMSVTQLHSYANYSQIFIMHLPSFKHTGFFYMQLFWFGVLFYCFALFLSSEWVGSYIEERKVFQKAFLLVLSFFAYFFHSL